MNKKSITLIEILFILIISTVLFISISNINLDLNKSNLNEYNKNILKIEFESVRLFLEKNYINKNKLNKLSYKNNILYFNNNILLKNIISYNYKSSNEIVTINICLKNTIKMCQTIRIRNGI